jgi:alanine racemase
MHSQTTLIIDLNALAENYNYLKSLKPNTQIAGVVKANAYGVGLEEVARVLEINGCSNFFVATLDEALNLRKITEKAIYVFNGVNSREEITFINNNITPILNSLSQVEIWQFATKDLNKVPTFAIHIDSGMNRLGIDVADIDKVKHHKSLVLTHFMDAENRKSSLTKTQLNNIKKIVENFTNSTFSFSNSQAIINFPQLTESIARPGIALYGGVKHPSIKGLIKIYSKIIQLKEVRENGYIGYNGIDKAKKGMKLATIAIGYADGYLRSAAGNGYCFINNKKAKVLGKISMDLIVLDVSSIDGVKVGDEVEIIGDNISLNDFAQFANTSPYEVLTRFGSSQRLNKIFI